MAAGYCFKHSTCEVNAASVVRSELENKVNVKMLGLYAVWS